MVRPSACRMFVCAGVLLLLVALLPMPGAVANPVLGYCPGSVHDQPDPQLCETLTGRVFPEAMESTDFISFWEFEAGMDYLLTQYNDPKRVEMFSIGDSYGLENPLSGDRDKFPVYIVEVTNHDSPIPIDERIDLLFMLSIHGNEKGAREGGMRVIEDFTKGIGMATEEVQNGAGMPQPMTKPTGGQVETYVDYLDFVRLVFIFPNPDGWVSDEFPYAAANQCLTLFCRENGNGTDLNRQAPSIGWHRINQDAGRLPLNEPESQAYIPYLRDNYNFSYATDIHGMLNHNNFVAIMMPAGQLNPVEQARAVRIADMLKDNLNGDDHFALWREVLGTAADTADEVYEEIVHEAEELLDPVCDAADACVPHNLPGAASTTFADWMSVWDAIGYTDSGFHGDWFAQRHGLNAPAYDIELAYNHITFDSQYQGPGQLMNDYHVHAVRHIVKTFMDQGALDVQVTLETHGSKTLYLPPSFVATNVGRDEASPGGAVEENPHTRGDVYNENNPFFASAGDYFREMVPFVAEGDSPGVLERAREDRITPGVLERYDNFVIAGSAIRDIENDEAALQAVLDWVEAGGNLVLTDESLRFLDLVGITDSAVEGTVGYVGAIEIDYSHPLASEVRTNSRQTYEPVPLGYTVESNSAPMWGVLPAAWDSLDAVRVGTLYNSDHVGLGIIDQGEGTVHVIGALLPDPSEEFYHPFGLDSYATIPTGNTLLRNALGWEQRFITPPVVITEDGSIVRSETHPVVNETEAQDADADLGATPAAGVVPFMMVVLLGVLIVRRRWDR